MNICLLILIIVGYSEVTGLTCYCENYCPDNSQFNGTCTVGDNSFCFSAVELFYDPELSAYREYRTWGCLGANEQGLMQCRAYLTTFQRPRNITCCREGDSCNLDLLPQLIIPEPEPTTYDPLTVVIIVALVSVCSIIVACLLVLLVHRYRDCLGYSLKKLKYGRYYGKHAELETVEIKKQDESGMDMSSASGSGVPRLTQRTVSKSVELLDLVGEGRYGKVIFARYHGGYVAVKLFLTTDEASWEREKDIYETPLLRHENILGFRFTDIRTLATCPQMLLVTDFHDFGSLHDYLQDNVLDHDAMLKLISSAIAGLNHLHSEVVGRNSKPAIAHRDIKSKNILVKANRECCLADFGLAVKYSSEDDYIDFGKSTRVVGTCRYIAPEVLRDSIMLTIFDSLKMADMYSFGLVMWEIIRRCRCIVGAVVYPELEYQLPFHEFVSQNPSLEDMRLVVCEKRLRPEILPQWRADPIVCRLARSMEECWEDDSNARLTALRVKKKVNELIPEKLKFLENMRMKRKS